MRLRDRILAALRLDGCKKLIPYTTTSIDLSAVGLNAGPAKFSVGELKITPVQFESATEIAKTLDDYQFDMCKTIAGLDNKDPDKRKYRKWRIGAMSLLSGLRAAVEVFKVDGKDGAKRLDQVNEATQEFMIAVARATAPVPAVPKAARKPVRTGARPPRATVGVVPASKLKDVNFYSVERAFTVPPPPAGPVSAGINPDWVLQHAYEIGGLTNRDVDFLVNAD